MKKLNRYCFIVTLILFTTACSSPHLEIFPELNDSSLLGKKLPVKALRQDIEAYYQGAKERHPALVQYADEQELKDMVSALQAQITQPMGRLEFYRIVGQLSHKFNDGHSFLIWPYQEYESLKAQGKKPFPLAVTLTSDGSVLTKQRYTNGATSIPAGAKIVAVNGLSIQVLMAHMQKFVGGESRFLREQIISQRFGPMLWAIYGYIDKFELQWQQADAPSLQLTSLDSQQNWHIEQQGDTEQQEFYFKILTGKSGYLYIGHFDVELDWFKPFIDRTFADIYKEEVTNLIIDLRENPGGNTDTAGYLLSYIADKDFRMISHMTEKLNQQNRGIFNYKGKPGQLLNYEWDEWLQPIDNHNRFNGQVFVLISPVTYSAAIVFASAAQDNQFATLVGQKTEGYANQTAQGNLFNLPNSRLRAYITTRILVRPSGETGANGVIPDIQARPDAESIASGRDPAVDKVLSLQNKGG